MRRELAIGAAVLVATARVASAELLELLDFACNPDGKQRNFALRMARTDCGLARDYKQACDVVAGEPFVCWVTDAAISVETCHSKYVSFTINVGTTPIAGWTIEGELKVSASYATTFAGFECSLEPRDPPNDTGAGTYVHRGGVATIEVSFVASGEGSIKFLGGKIFSKQHTEKCETSDWVEGHETQTTQGCSTGCAARQSNAFATCTPDPDPDPEPEPEPEPEPDPEPEPEPDPDPEPDPEPVPVPVPDVDTAPSDEPTDVPQPDDAPIE